MGWDLGYGIWVGLGFGIGMGFWQRGWDFGKWDGIWDGMGQGILPSHLIWAASISGNSDIDKFIQDTQLSVHKSYKVSNALEWIPYDRFHNIKHNEKIGVFRVNWIDGYIYGWDIINQNWKRKKNNMIVMLKILNTPKNITLEFMNKV